MKGTEKIDIDISVTCASARIVERGRPLTSEEEEEESAYECEGIDIT